MLLIAALTLAVVWALVVAVVVGLCLSAARGDRTARERVVKTRREAARPRALRLSA